MNILIGIVGIFIILGIAAIVIIHRSNDYESEYYKSLLCEYKLIETTPAGKGWELTFQSQCGGIRTIYVSGQLNYREALRSTVTRCDKCGRSVWIK